MVQLMKYFILFLILMKSVNSSLLIRPNDIYEGVIKTIYDYHHCKSLTFLYASSSTLSSVAYLGFKEKMELVKLHLVFSRNHLIPTVMIDTTKFPSHVKKYVDDSNNSLFIILNDYDDIKSQLMTTVFTSSVNLSKGLWLIFFQNSTDIKSFFNHFYIPMNCKFLISKSDINKMKTEIITNVYHIGYKFKLIHTNFGTWNLDTGLSPPKSSFYYSRSNLHGLKTRIAMSSDSVSKVKNSIYVGNVLFFRLMLLLSETMNFTTITNFSKSVGVCDDKNCTGIFLGLINNNSDICVSPMIMLGERLKFVDMTINLYAPKLFVFIKQVNPNLGWKKFFEPFETTIWIVICFFLLFSSVILFLMEKIYSMDSKFRLWAGLRLKPPKFIDCIFKIFGILCTKDIGRSPSIPIRTIQVTIQIASVLILTPYAAQLIQSLTAGIMFVPPHTSVPDFLADETYRLGSTPWIFYFINLNSSMEMYRRVNEKLLKETSLPLSDYEGFERLCKYDKYALLSYYEVLQWYYLPSKCMIASVGAVVKNEYAYGLQKNSPLREVINFQLLRLWEYGLKQRITKRLERYQIKRDQNKKIWIPVNFTHIYPLIIFLIGIMILSFILLCGEIIIDNKMKKKRQADALRRLNATFKKIEKLKDTKKYLNNIQEIV